MLELIKIDLKKCSRKDGLYQDHPDISLRKQYLAKINGSYYAGTFSRQWYGLNFNDWGCSGLQLDKPGTNSSMWQGLWEIRSRKSKKK